MAIELTPTNILQLTSILAPLLVVFFLIMVSIFNQNIKGFVYLLGAILALLLNMIASKTIKSPRYEVHESNPICHIISFDLLTKYNSPSASCLILGYTFAYLLQPMIFNKQMNYFVIAAMMGLIGIDMMTKVKMKCTTAAGTLMGVTLGIVVAIIWYNILRATNNESLLYFEELQSNNVKCSQPSKQTFKCSVYKNGELVSSNIA